MNDRRDAIERSLLDTHDWFDPEISEDLSQAFIALVDRGMLVRVRDEDGKDRWMLTEKGKATRRVLPTPPPTTSTNRKRSSINGN